MGLQIQRRAHIVWENSAPRTVFIVKKSSSLATSQKLSEIGDWCAGSLQHLSRGRTLDPPKPSHRLGGR